MSRRRQRGSTLVEFTLVGIPLLFTLISIFEMARGMWMFHTLQYAVKETARYAAVHGQNCATAPNACTVTAGQVAARMRSAGVGLPADRVNLTLTSVTGSITCTLSQCLSDTTVWPPAPGNRPGLDLEVSATYPFHSAIVMFWPGVRGGGSFAAVNFQASAQEQIEF